MRRFVRYSSFQASLPLLASYLNTAVLFPPIGRQQPSPSNGQSLNQLRHWRNDESLLRYIPSGVYSGTSPQRETARGELPLSEHVPLSVNLFQPSTESDPLEYHFILNLQHSQWVEYVLATGTPVDQTNSPSRLVLFGSDEGPGSGSDLYHTLRSYYGAEYRLKFEWENEGSSGMGIVRDGEKFHILQAAIGDSESRPYVDLLRSILHNTIEQSNLFLPVSSVQARTPHSFLSTEQLEGHKILADQEVRFEDARVPPDDNVKEYRNCFVKVCKWNSNMHANLHQFNELVGGVDIARIKNDEVYIRMPNLEAKEKLLSKAFHLYLLQREAFIRKDSMFESWLEDRKTGSE